MSLEDAGLCGSSRHSDLAHDRMQKVGAVWWFAENPVIGLDQPIGHGMT